MAYALTIIVVSAFLIVYFIVKKKPKEEWQATLDEKRYLEKCKAFVLDMPIPKKTSQINDKFFKRHIKNEYFSLKTKKVQGDICRFLRRQTSNRTALQNRFFLPLRRTVDKPNAALGFACKTLPVVKRMDIYRGQIQNPRQRTKQA